MHDLGFELPSKIQSMAIPIICKPPHNNLLAQSQNGSGKTLAFVLGSLARVDPKINEVQVLILSPVRELAKQTYNLYLSVTKNLPEIKISLLIPESPTTGLGHILIGTPATLLREIDKNKKKFEKVRVLVIDEADMAFDPKSELSKHVHTLCKKTNPKKQILLFSATFNEETVKNAKEFLKEAAIMRVPQAEQTLKGVLQLYMKCDDKKKFEKILQIYDKLSIPQTIVFCNTRAYAQKFYDFMTTKGHSISLLMGGKMSALERDTTVKSFQNRETSMLISTNLLARGYDNRFVALVINLDIPRLPGSEEPDPENYLHRVGRTGRFGDVGIALNIVESETDMKLISKLKEIYKCTIEETQIEALKKQVNEIKKIRELEAIKEQKEEAEAAKAKAKAKKP